MRPTSVEAGGNVITTHCSLNRLHFTEPQTIMGDREDFISIVAYFTRLSRTSRHDSTHREFRNGFYDRLSGFGKLQRFLL